MENIASKFVIPWKALVGFAVIIAAVDGIELGVATGIKNHATIAYDAPCTAKSYDTDDSKIVMQLDCGGASDKTKDPDFVAAYLRNPGPFTCHRYKGIRADCTLQKAKKPGK